jgi:hypothetical protein
MAEHPAAPLERNQTRSGRLTEEKTHPGGQSWCVVVNENVIVQ